jgi:hypothetical protein
LTRREVCANVAPMNEETVWLGPTPAGERCAQLGDPDYARDARIECRAFADAIRKVCGREPEGARLVIKPQEVDAGTYYELACVYDGDNEWAARYAAKVDAEAPTTWAAAGMKPPVRRARAR